MIKYQFFPKTKEMPEHLIAVTDAFKSVANQIDSLVYQLDSNTVLSRVSPELKKLSFAAEPEDGKIKVPVLFGLNNAVEQHFEADAFNAATKTVIEVEAGRALTNYQFLKDLFEACMMHDTQFLVIAVRNKYRTSPDFDKIYKFFDTMYQSERINLPLSGILLIGY